VTKGAEVARRHRRPAGSVRVAWSRRGLNRRGRWLVALLVVATIAGILAFTHLAGAVETAPTVSLRVEADRPGARFQPGAVGLSVETEELSTGRLDGAHGHLVHLMRLLGPSLLRVGGNSVDFSWWTSRGEPAPPWATNTVTPNDLMALRELLRATGWRALLGVDLGHYEVARIVNEAHYAREILGTMLAGIEIGNEPDDFSGPEQRLRPLSYNVRDYLREAGAYRQAVSLAVPGMAIYGASLSGTAWLTQMGPDASMFTELTQHFYPNSNCRSAPESLAESPPTAEALLSPAVRQRENNVLRVLAQAAVIAGGRPTRIGETNGFSCQGAPSASPTFASSLWAFDWALRAASSGVQGLSFHGGLGVCGSDSQSPICAANESADRAGNVTARAQYYGLLAARRLEGGRFVWTSLSGAGPLSNLTAWATVSPSGTLAIAVEDLAVTGPGQPVSLLARGYTAGIDETLSGPSPSATAGITLGHSSVTSGAVWHPKYSSLQREGSDFHVLLHPASAAVIVLYRRHSRG
jgi:hypothetical protein